MYFKRGKSLGVFQKKEDIRAGTFYEMIMFGDFLLILVSSDDKQNGFFIWPLPTIFWCFICYWIKFYAGSILETWEVDVNCLFKAAR